MSIFSALNISELKPNKILRIPSIFEVIYINCSKTMSFFSDKFDLGSNRSLVSMERDESLLILVFNMFV